MKNIQQTSIDWISKSKGFGILGIIAVHTVQKFNIEHISSIAYAGMYCVQLFFIISAYLTFRSLEIKNDILSVKTYFNYLFHKILRLIPVLYIVCSYFLICHCIELKSFPAINDTIWPKFFFSISFFNGFSYAYNNPWGNWYIGNLFIFLVMAPFLRKLVNTSKKAVILFAVSALFSSLTIFFMEKKGIDTSWYFYFWFPRQFPLMAIGIVFFYFEKDGFESSLNSIYTFLFLIISGFLLSFCWNTFIEKHVQYGLLLISFCYILFNKLESGRLFFLLKKLGDNSYGMYLFHICILPLISFFIKKLDIRNSSFCFILCYILVLLFSYIISRAVNIFIEKPLFSYMKRNYNS